MSGQSELLTEMTLEGDLSSYWDHYDEPNEALENLGLGLGFKEFITAPSATIDAIDTETFGFSSENLNLNSVDDTVTVEFFTAAWTGSNYSFTKN